MGLEVRGQASDGWQLTRRFQHTTVDNSKTGLAQTSLPHPIPVLALALAYSYNLRSHPRDVQQPSYYHLKSMQRSSHREKKSFSFSSLQLFNNFINLPLTIIVQKTTSYIIYMEETFKWNVVVPFDHAPTRSRASLIITHDVVIARTSRRRNIEPSPTVPLYNMQYRVRGIRKITPLIAAVSAVLHGRDSGL